MYFTSFLLFFFFFFFFFCLFVGFFFCCCFFFKYWKILCRIERLCEEGRQVAVAFSEDTVQSAQLINLTHLCHTKMH